MFGRELMLMPECRRVDERPPVWVGHLVLNVSDLSRSVEFWHEIGMRQVEKNDDVAMLELRGGTHLCSYRAPRTRVLRRSTSWWRTSK